MSLISETDLILNADGSIYHLSLKAEDIGNIIFLVGDPGRVAHVSGYFDSITVKKSHREFVTHTGFLGNKKVSVISTGIGTDNIDIVINELDVLAKVDLKTRVKLSNKRVFKFIRLGTSGALQKDIVPDSILVSQGGIGMDALGTFYFHTEKNDAMKQWYKLIQNAFAGVQPYGAWADQDLLQWAKEIGPNGITATCAGFYGPQGRSLILPAKFAQLPQTLSSLNVGEQRITNFEMETAAIYFLSELMGHKALSINAILANRIQNQFSKDPAAMVDKMIKRVLDLVRVSDLFVS